MELRGFLGLALIAAISITAQGQRESIIGISGDDTRHGLVVLLGSQAELELSRYHVDTLVQTRFARTVVQVEIRNKGNYSKNVTVPFAIPQKAMLVNFEIVSGGKVHQARPMLKDDVQVDLVRSSATITARDTEAFDVELQLAPESVVELKIEYEELLARRLQRYKNVQQIWPGTIVQDLRVSVRIKEPSTILNTVNHTLTTSAASGGVTTVPTDGLVTVSKVLGSNGSVSEVLVTLQPSVQQQRALAEQLGGAAEAGIGGQFNVEYDVARYPTAGDIVVRDGYFAHFFAPSGLQVLPKYALFLLDVSGSMAGRKIAQLRDAMSTILGELGPGDFFTVIEFSDNNNMWSLGVPSVGKTCNVYSSQHIKEAQKRAEQMTDLGGTAMLGGLEQILECAADGPEGLEPIVLLLTDGVPNEPKDKIIADTSALNRPTGRDEELTSSIFTLALGSDADLSFLNELALRNGGSSRQIYEASDASLQLQDFYRSIATPLLKDVSVAFDYQQADQATLSQHDFRTYFWGSEIVVAGRLLPGQGDTLNGTVSATGAGGAAVQYSIQVSALPDWQPERLGGKANSERLWAFLRTNQLLDQAIVEGRNSAAANESIEIALSYSFVTTYTCLAVDIIHPYEATTDSDSPTWAPSRPPRTPSPSPPPRPTSDPRPTPPPSPRPTPDPRPTPPPRPTSEPRPTLPPPPPSSGPAGSRVLQNTISVGSIAIGSLSINGPLIQFNLR